MLLFLGLIIIVVLVIFLLPVLILGPGTILGLIFHVFSKLVVNVVNAVTKKQNVKFEKEYLAEPVKAEKLQRKMTFLYFSGRARLILGVLMMVGSVITWIVVFMRSGSMYLDEFLALTVPCALIAIAGYFLLLFIGRTKLKLKQLVSLIVKPVIEEVFGGDAVYEFGNRISDETVGSSGFLHGYKYIEGSDLVRCQYKGAQLMFSDIKVIREEAYYDEEEKKTKTKYVTIFKGYWIAADFDRDLTPVALNVHEERNSAGIQMESMAFNNKFNVYSSDEHTAFYILTPHFMERLMEVDKITNGVTRFRFDKNRLQIAVHTNKDMFEPGRFKVPNVAGMQRRFRMELGQITGVMDEMLLHERLFGEASPSPRENTAKDLC